MAITSVTELAGDRSGTFSIRGGRTYTLTLDLTTDTQLYGPRSIMLELGLAPSTTYRYPITSAAYEEDLASFLQSIRVDTIENGFQHRVTLEFGPYDSSINGPAQGDGAAQWIMAPFMAPPTIKWSSSSEDFACTHDRDGKPILNTAGDPFDPPIQIPVSTPVAVVTRVLKAFDPAWITVFKDSVNADEWLGFPPESVLCQEITADKFYDADWGWLWTVTYELAFRPSFVDITAHGIVIDPGWAVQVLNAGLRKKVAGVKQQVLIDDAPVSSPVPLKENGDYDPEADPYFLSFNVRRTADFSLLDLPSDLFSVSTP